jgi:hypothetical protein
MGPPEVCMQLEGVLKGVYGALNPDYEFVYDCMRAKGDHSCHWTVKRKAIRAEDSSVNDIVSDDPSRRVRFDDC